MSSEPSSTGGAEPGPERQLRVAVIGGHGQIGRQLIRGLAAAGHRGLGVVRREDQVTDVRADGGEPVLFDLESETAAALAAQIGGADAVVFAAGAGPGSGPARKMTVDRDGALLAADAAELAGIRRVVVVSALAADDFEVGSDDVFQIYLRAKSEADELIRSRDLDWTVVRPGGLLDDPPTGSVQIAERTGPGSIPRADVAAVLVELLTTGSGIRRQFELISGDVPIATAVARLG